MLAVASGKADTSGDTEFALMRLLEFILGESYYDDLNEDKASLIENISANWGAIVAATEAAGGRFLDSETREE